jgi:succinate dehydrogenase (ubiquinone) cytochrome b560 subunit
MMPADSYQIHVNQRRTQPTFPHLSIYGQQITWYLSDLNRITGATLSGATYLFGMAYLIAPVTGWHLESASIAAAFAT